MGARKSKSGGSVLRLAGGKAPAPTEGPCAPAFQAAETAEATAQPPVAENYMDTQERVRREREQFLKGYQSPAMRKTDCPPGCSPT